MLIKEMYNSPRYPNHYIVELLDGTCKLILYTPFRRVTEKDLLPCFAKPHQLGAVPVNEFILRSYGMVKEGKPEVKEWIYRHDGREYTIRGTSLRDAVGKNMDDIIIRLSNIGAGCYKHGDLIVNSISFEYRPGILGGKGGVVATFYCTSNDKCMKDQYTLWIHADENDLC